MTDLESFSIYSSGDEEEEKSKIYEPDTKLIAKYYCEIKEKKVLILDWKFPGRLTAAEYEEENRADNEEVNTGDKQKDSNDSSNMNDFDFDEDFDTDLSMNPLIKKKPTSAAKKVTNLDKVMNDIKKYQKIDKQTKKLSIDDEKV